MKRTLSVVICLSVLLAPLSAEAGLFRRIKQARQSAKQSYGDNGRLIFNGQRVPLVRRGVSKAARVPAKAARVPARATGRVLRGVGSLFRRN